MISKDPQVIISSVIAVIVCLVCAGLASGLTQGLLSLDFLELTIKLRSGTDIEKKQAAALLPIIERHHLLLVSLMLMNAAAMEILPIYLDNLVETYIAIILSVTLILIVGEIGPAALMTGKHQLTIVYNLTYLVYVVFILFFPIAYPVSKLLDFLLGVDEGVTTYSRVQLSEMVKIQHEEQLRRGSVNALNDGVNKEEITMIDGVLRFGEAEVKDIMTSEVFMLSMDDRLSLDTLNKIFKSGYSRIPIYENKRDDVVGLILAKDLIFIDPDDEVPMRNFLHLFSRPIQTVWPDEKLGDVLQKFRNSHGHMAVVRDVEEGDEKDNRYKVVGIITLEDIFERILGNEIIDETDTVDEYNQVTKNRNRDFDLMRMSIINPSILGLDKRQQLSVDEVRVVTAHLLANVPIIAQLVENNSQAVEALVRSSTVVELKRAKPVDGSEDTIHSREQHPENVLYKRGKVANYCVLILSGKAMVIVGKDDFKSEVGSWMTLGANALSPTEDEYVPDFSAYVESDDLKYLRIAKPLNAGALLSPSNSYTGHTPAPITTQSSIKKQVANLQQARHYSGPLAPLGTKFMSPHMREHQQRLLQASRESTSLMEQENEPTGLLAPLVTDDSEPEEKSETHINSHTININN